MTTQTTTTNETQPDRRAEEKPIHRPVFYRVGRCGRCVGERYAIQIGKSVGDSHDSYCGCGNPLSWKDHYTPFPGQESIVKELGYWQDEGGWRSSDDEQPDPTPQPETETPPEWSSKPLDYLPGLVGSCNCLTKTPDPKFHNLKCPYRMLRQIHERGDLLTTARSELASVKAEAGWWNCQCHGETPTECKCGSATHFNAYKPENAKLRAQLSASTQKVEEMWKALRQAISLISSLQSICLSVRMSLSYKDWAFIFSAPNNGGDRNVEMMREVDLRLEQAGNYKTDDLISALIPEPAKGTEAGTQPECSICRQRHGKEIQHATE